MSLYGLAVFSAVYALAVASPALRDLDVDWVHPDAPLAHPLDDGSAVVLERSLDATAGRLGRDGDAYRKELRPLVEALPAIADLRLVRAGRALGPARPIAALEPASTFARKWR